MRGGLASFGHVENIQPQVPAPLRVSKVTAFGPIGRAAVYSRALNHAPEETKKLGVLQKHLRVGDVLLLALLL